MKGTSQFMIQSKTKEPPRSYHLISCQRGVCTKIEDKGAAGWGLLSCQGEVWSLLFTIGRRLFNLLQGEVFLVNVVTHYMIHYFVFTSESFWAHITFHTGECFVCMNLLYMSYQTTLRPAQLFTFWTFVIIRLRIWFTCEGWTSLIRYALSSYAFPNCLRDSKFFHIYHRHILRLYHVLSPYAILYCLRSSRFFHIYHRQILRLYHELSSGVNPFHQRNRTFSYIFSINLFRIP